MKQVTAVFFAMSLSATAYCADLPQVISFHVTRPADPDELTGRVTPELSFTKSGVLIATAYVVTLGEEDPSMAKGWVESNNGQLVLCYRLPPYPMPKLTSPNAYAAVAYPSRLEYRIAGLTVIPESVVVSNRCKGANKSFKPNPLRGSA